MSNLSATSNYSNSAVPANPTGSRPLDQGPFLQEVHKIDELLTQLPRSIEQVKGFHREAVNSADSNPPAGLEAAVADTQTLNTTIRNNIKYLEADAARSNNDATKTTQVKRLKRSFQALLQEYLDEERSYRAECAKQIKRQYKIVYPNASDAEAEEAAQQDWGNEGVFQTAVSVFDFQHVTTYLRLWINNGIAQRQYSLKTSKCSCRCRPHPPQRDCTDREDHDGTRGYV
jgi:syntaxin 1B/2/3